MQYQGWPLRRCSYRGRSLNLEDAETLDPRARGQLYPARIAAAAGWRNGPSIGQKELDCSSPGGWTCPMMLDGCDVCHRCLISLNTAHLNNFQVIDVLPNLQNIDALAHQLHGCSKSLYQNSPPHPRPRPFSSASQFCIPPQLYKYCCRPAVIVLVEQRESHLPFHALRKPDAATQYRCPTAFC